MKKIYVLLMLAIVAIMPLVNAININNSNEEIKQIVTEFSNEEFTHMVFCEIATTITCPYCPGASDMLYSIYNSEDYDFRYVTLVYNVGSEITKYRVMKRAYEELGISSIPHAFFDGKYSNYLGRPTEVEAYKNIIENAGVRIVPDIDINVNVELKENSVLEITGTVQNNDPEKYNGHLRVYIVEPESRWDDVYGEPYHFSVLDIPIDKSLNVKQKSTSQIQSLAETYDFSITWGGFLLGYNDISVDNIMVIAAVFDKDTDYAVQVASAIPDSLTTDKVYSDRTTIELEETTVIDYIFQKSKTVYLKQFFIGLMQKIHR